MTDKETSEAVQDLTVEESFARLEELVSRLENGNASLEETFRMYARGMELLKNCSDKIDLVEKKMLRISEDGKLREF